MPIAKIAFSWKLIPPSIDNGVELVVSLIAQKLVQRGHSIALFAFGQPHRFDENGHAPKLFELVINRN